MKLNEDSCVALPTSDGKASRCLVCVMPMSLPAGTDPLFSCRFDVDSAHYLPGRTAEHERTIEKDTIHYIPVERRQKSHRFSMPSLLQLAAASLWLLLQSSTADQPQCSTDDDKGDPTGSCRAQTAPSSEPAPFTCGIYMGPSTIPGAGLGIFTGIERHPGETVGDGDVLIPIVDVWWHLQASQDYNNYHSAPDTLDPTADYVWHGPEMGMQDESSNADKYVTAFCPGLDAAINCNLAVLNVDKELPVYDMSKLHRSRDAGAGAFTPYHNCTTTVIADVPVGGELFKFYGDK
jgi:hypothetical protein